MVEPRHIPLYQELSNRENVEYIVVLWEYACREVATAVSNEKKSGSNLNKRIQIKS